MQKLVVILLFILANVPVFSESTCSELYQQIKASDCGSKVFQWLDGAYLKVGISLSVSEVDLNDSEYEEKLSSQRSTATPFPAFSLTFPNNYLGSTGFAWSWGVGYMYNMGYEQIIKRGNDEAQADLHSYFTLFNVSVNPSIFYVFGREDRSNWPYWGKVGFGLGLGGGRVKGFSYLTEDKSDGACYEAGDKYLEGDFAEADVRNACAVLSYSEIGLGASVAILLEFRVKSFILSLETSALSFKSRLYNFVSAQVNYSLTYAIPL